MSDDFTNLAQPASSADTVLRFTSSLGLAPGDYVRLGNAGDEIAKVLTVDDSGLVVTVVRGVKGTVRAHPLLDNVATVKTYEWGVRMDDNTDEWHGGQEHVARARAREYHARLIRRVLPEVVEDYR